MAHPLPPSMAAAFGPVPGGATVPTGGRGGAGIPDDRIDRLDAASRACRIDRAAAPPD